MYFDIKVTTVAYNVYKEQVRPYEIIYTNCSIKLSFINRYDVYLLHGNVSSLQRIFIFNEFLNEGTLKNFKRV